MAIKHRIVLKAAISQLQGHSLKRLTMSCELEYGLQTMSDAIVNH